MSEWQKELFKYSYMKKEKVSIITKHIKPFMEDEIVLDVGCAQGTVSYFLKKKLSGKWLSMDLDYRNLKVAKSILKKNVVQIKDFIPVKSESVKTVFSLDYIEHVEEDEGVLREVFRVLKRGGQLIISTPTSKKFMILNMVKKLFGMKPKIYGHKREGYSPKDLKRILEKNGFTIEFITTYSKFFTELVELVLNIIFVKIIKKGKFSNLRDGNISPKSENEFRGNKFYGIYRYVYPFLRALTFVDRLLFFKTGYAILVVCKKK